MDAGMLGTSGEDLGQGHTGEDAWRLGPVQGIVGKERCLERENGGGLWGKGACRGESRRPGTSGVRGKAGVDVDAGGRGGL